MVLSGGIMLGKENKIKNLIAEAKRIPELGHGGKTIAKYLLKYASLIDKENDIVEVGPWFGSSTAFISIGLMQSKNKKSTIHCFDKWDIDRDYKKKMDKRYKDNLELGDAKKYFVEYMKPYKAKLKTYKGKIQDVKKYDGKNIELLVDDICFGKEKNDSMFKLFSGSFITNKTVIILMDYYYYLAGGEYDNPEMRYQKRFMRENEIIFEPISKTKQGTAQIFRYMGGKINYEVPE
jgi:hypothetical protein